MIICSYKIENNGAIVPNNVALAIVVSLRALKKNIKWKAKKIPAKMILEFCLFTCFCFLKNGKQNHSINAPNAILQNAIVMDGTSFNRLTKIAEELTLNKARTNNDKKGIFCLFIGKIELSLIQRIMYQ